MSFVSSGPAGSPHSPQVGVSEGVIPAKAGIQKRACSIAQLDPRLRGGDDFDKSLKQRSNKTRLDLPLSRNMLFIITLLLTTACGAPSVDSSNVVAKASTVPGGDTASDTESAVDSDDDSTADDVTQLIVRDAHAARDILVDALHSDDETLASWAAVYIRLLRVDADEDVVAKNLNRGTAGDDLLLKALSYRWLVDSKQSLSGMPTTEDDPVVQLFLGLAQLSRGTGENDSQIAEWLSVGDARVFHEEKISLNALLQQTAPFDNGALALAIAFVNARRMSLAVKVDDVKAPLSAGYRHRLLSVLQITSEIPESPETTAVDFTLKTSLHSHLENPLGAQPIPALRNIVVGGADTLKRDALRALAAKVLEPEVGDFAAAATAFKNKDATIRLEAARTYLLLVTRATKDEP